MLRSILLLCIIWNVRTNGDEITSDLRNVSVVCTMCECLDPRVVDCDDMNLSKFPEWHDDLDVLYRLRLQGNSLTEITKLPPMQNLHDISFKYNLIRRIDESAFAGLPNLYKLDLSHNKLTANTLNKDAFKGPYDESLPNPLQNLKFLDLSFNELAKIPDQLLFHVTNLTVLSLRGNPLVDLSTRSIETFTEAPLITDLDLAYCQLRRLPAHMFSDLRHLKTLDLSGNFFTAIPSEVNFIPSLETLFLNDVLIEVITEGSFYENMYSLQTIHLNNLPRLTSVGDYTFANLTGLSKLFLEGNPRLRVLEPFVFSSVYNTTLHIEEIHLQHNSLQSLPKSAIGWAGVDYVDLQHNPWKCDCHFEYIVQGLIKKIAATNKELTLQILCASPEHLMYQRVLNERVQLEKYNCYSKEELHNTILNFLVVTLVMLGCILFVTGTLLFAYVLFQRSQQVSSDWLGDRVRYRRTGPTDVASHFY